MIVCQLVPKPLSIIEPAAENSCPVFHGISPEQAYHAYGNTNPIKRKFFLTHVLISPFIQRLVPPGHRLPMYLSRENARASPGGMPARASTYVVPGKAHLPKLARAGPNSSNRLSSAALTLIQSGRSLAYGRGRPQFSSQKSVLMPITQNIVVRILSNWGNPDFVSASEVAILNARKQQVQVCHVSVNPPDAGSDLLPRLVDSVVMKSSAEACWRAPVPKDGVIEITFCVPETENLQFVRVFNCAAIGDAAIRSIEVWKEDAMLWKGDIDKEFGFIAPIGKVVVQKPREVPVVKEPFRDRFGLVPQVEVTRMQIDFLSNYGCPTMYGLSGIEIIDASGARITTEQIAAVRPLNGDAQEHARLLFRGSYETPQLDKMFTIEPTGKEPPGLDIEFKKSFYIGRVRFWNIYSPEYPIAAGCQRTRIKIGGRVVWVGKLKQGDGEPKNLGKSVTTVALGDSNGRLSRRSGVSM